MKIQISKSKIVLGLAGLSLSGTLAMAEAIRYEGLNSKGSICHVDIDQKSNGEVLMSIPDVVNITATPEKNEDEGQVAIKISNRGCDSSEAQTTAYSASGPDWSIISCKPNGELLRTFVIFNKNSILPSLISGKQGDAEFSCVNIHPQSLDEAQ